MKYYLEIAIESFFSPNFHQGLCYTGISCLRNLNLVTKKAVYFPDGRSSSRSLQDEEQSRYKQAVQQPKLPVEAFSPFPREKRMFLRLLQRLLRRQDESVGPWEYIFPTISHPGMLWYSSSKFWRAELRIINSVVDVVS